ncbi:MAG: opacity protein-like surface antigen [Maricaulis maris]|jgi:opacity protein-like surface antigen
MKHLILTTALVAVFSAGAQAQDSRFTLSEGYAYQQFDEFNAHSTNGRLSYNLNDFIRLEANAVSGLSGSSGIDCPVGEDCSSIEPRARFRYGYGVSIAGEYPVSEQLSMFARIGYDTANFKATAGPTGNDSGMSLGAGADFYFNDAHGVRLEYSRTEFDDRGDASSWGISYVRRF